VHAARALARVSPLLAACGSSELAIEAHQSA
jgi:hypothetical protein